MSFKNLITNTNNYSIVELILKMNLNNHVLLAKQKKNQK